MRRQAAAHRQGAWIALVVGALASQTMATDRQRIQLAPLADSATLVKLLPWLEGGELTLVRSYRSGAFKQASLAGLVKAPPARVWELLTAYEGYAEMVPSVVRAEVIERSQRRAVVAFEIEVPGSNLQLRLAHRLVPPERIDVWVDGDDGDVRLGAWRWELLPCRGGRWTIVVHSLYARWAEATSWTNLRAAGPKPMAEYTLNLANGLEMLQALKRQLAGRSTPPENGHSPASQSPRTRARGMQR